MAAQIAYSKYTIFLRNYVEFYSIRTIVNYLKYIIIHIIYSTMSQLDSNITYLEQSLISC